MFILGFEPKRTTLGCVHFINGLKKIVMTIIREVVAQWFVLPYTEHCTQQILYFIVLIRCYYSIVLIRALQRNRTSKIYTHREIYRKELAHRIMKAGRSQDLQRYLAEARDTGKQIFYFESEGRKEAYVQRQSGRRNSLSLWGVSFCSIQAFDWLDEVHLP